MSDPIPPQLAQAFQQAIGSYAAWIENGGPEYEFPVLSPYTNLNQRMSLSSICELVRPYTDMMPERIYNQLEMLARYRRDGEYVPKDKTYQGGAKSLGDLIAYELDQRRRREQELAWRK